MWTQTAVIPPARRPALALGGNPWPSPQRPTSLCTMPHSGNFFHLHLVSDSTGETLITVARAAAAQYTTVSPVETGYPAVGTNNQLYRVLSEIEDEPGVVLYTLLEQDLIGRLENKCRELGLPC